MNPCVYFIGREQPKYAAPEIWNQNAGLPARSFIPNFLVPCPEIHFGARVFWAGLFWYRDLLVPGFVGTGFVWYRFLLVPGLFGCPGFFGTGFVTGVCWYRFFL